MKNTKKTSGKEKFVKTKKVLSAMKGAWRSYTGWKHAKKVSWGLLGVGMSVMASQVLNGVDTNALIGFGGALTAFTGVSGVVSTWGKSNDSENKQATRKEPLSSKLYSENLNM